MKWGYDNDSDDITIRIVMDMETKYKYGLK